MNRNERIKDILEFRTQGLNLSEISRKMGVSRQYISMLLKDAGIEYIRTKVEKPLKKCPICEKEHNRLTKTCGDEYCKKEISRLKLIKDSKWSRNTLVDLICHYCGSSFLRTRYHIAITERSGKSKNCYCDRECYAKASAEKKTAYFSK